MPPLPPHPNRRPQPRPTVPGRPAPGRPLPTPPPLAGRTKELNHGAPSGFVKANPQVFRQQVHGDPVLYAVIGTWFEADIIEATVKNCLANGCTKVFIVDNESPDDTLNVALKAGATLGRVYRTQFYDDDLRLKLMNEVMQEVTTSEKLPQLWWLSLDADEFPCGPGGERILDYLKTLDPRINCVGADAIDLYPTTPPHYTPGMHPADCMDMGLRRKGVFCELKHWKHPLLRCTNGVFDLAQSRGSHTPFVRGQGVTPAFTPWEPETGLIIYHAPIRAKEATFKRLEKLCTKQAELGGHHRSAGDDGLIQSQGAVKRWRSLEHIYAGHWDQVELPHAQMYGGNVTGIALFPWRRLTPSIKTFPRWYRDELPAQRRLELPLVAD